MGLGLGLGVGLGLGLGLGLEGEALAHLHHGGGARRERAHVDLRGDDVGDGGVVEDADAVHEELVAREGAHLGDGAEILEEM